MLYLQILADKAKIILKNLSRFLWYFHVILFVYIYTPVCPNQTALHVNELILIR